jgi:cation:H+ antiporter
VKGVSFLALHATRNDALGLFHDAMLWFVIPLTAVTLVVHAGWAFKRRRATP